MTQKNTALVVPMLSKETGIIPTVSNGGSVPGAGARLVGAMPGPERPTNRNGSGVGSSKATRFGNWSIKAGTARGSCTA